MATAAAEVHDDGVGFASEEGCDEEEDVEKLVALSRAAARGDGAAGGVRDVELGGHGGAVAQAVRVLHPRGGDARRFARRTRGERVVVGGGILGTADERQGVHRVPREKLGRAANQLTRRLDESRGRALARASAARRRRSSLIARRGVRPVGTRDGTENLDSDATQGKRAGSQRAKRTSPSLPPRVRSSSRAPPDRVDAGTFGRDWSSSESVFGRAPTARHGGR